MSNVPPAIESSPRRSSGPFRFERDMFESVSSLLPRRIATIPGRWLQLREPTVGKVIPDLLVGEWRDELRPLKRHFTFIEARILALLEQYDEIFQREIPRMLGLSTLAASRAFKRIEQSGLLVQTTGGKISLDVGGFTRGLFVTAIELKLSRWREALDQATEYLNFADRAYVVLDADRASVDNAMAEVFRSSHVGLLLLTGDDLTEIVPAEEQHPVSVQRVQAVQKLCVSLTASRKLHPSVGAPFLEGV